MRGLGRSQPQRKEGAQAETPGREPQEQSGPTLDGERAQAIENWRKMRRGTRASDRQRREKDRDREREGPEHEP